MGNLLSTASSIWVDEALQTPSKVLRNVVQPAFYPDHLRWRSRRWLLEIASIQIRQDVTEFVFEDLAGHDQGGRPRLEMCCWDHISILAHSRRRPRVPGRRGGLARGVYDAPPLSSSQGI